MQSHFICAVYFNTPHAQDVILHDFYSTADMFLYLLLRLFNPFGKKDGKFSNILRKVESVFELAMKPQQSSFRILTLMSHRRVWGEAK